MLMDVQPYLHGPNVPVGGHVGPADEPGAFPNLGPPFDIVNLQEATGSAMDVRTTEWVHLYGQDVHSVQTDIGYTAAPVPSAGASGTLRTYERWVQVELTGFFNTVRQFRFWVANGNSLLNGWTLSFGTAATYQTPVNTASSIAVNPVPIVDPVTPNCGGDHRLIGPETQYSDWIVLQAAVDLSVVTAPGPALGYDVTNLAIPLDFNFTWIET